ncbi:MAG: PAS domain S-box protein [Balneolaceae bacterium]
MSEITEEKKLIDAYPDPAALVNEQGELQFVNRAWRNKRPDSSTPETLAGGDSYFVYLSQFAENGSDPALKLILGLRKVLDGKEESFSALLPYYSSNSEKGCYRVTVTAVEGDNPSYLLVQEDVSNAVRTTNELKESRERYRQQFHHSMLGIILAGSSGTILEANPASEKILGYTTEEFRVMKSEKLFEAESEVNRVANTERERNGQFQGKMELVHKLGHTVPVEMTSKIYRNEESDLHVIHMFHDISDQVRACREQQVAFELANQLFQNAPVGMVRVGNDETIREVNASFTRMFGYGQDESVSHRACDLLTSDQYREEANEITRQAYEGVPAQLKTVRHTRDGEEVPVLLDTVPVKVDGEVISVYGMYIDMREQVKLERQIKELYDKELKARETAEKANRRLEDSLKEKEVLLQEVHHRVKNNLAVIAGLLDLQMMDCSDVQLNTKLQQVQNRIYSIAHVHESIYQQEDVIGVELNTYIEKMADLIERNKDHELTIRLSLKPVKVNLNQAVSCGLLINEIITLFQNSLPEQSETELKIELGIENDQIRLIFRNQYLHCSSENLDSYEGKIIQVLLQQLNAKKEFTTGEVNRLAITFAKSNVKGSSSILYL